MVMKDNLTMRFRERFYRTYVSSHLGACRSFTRSQVDHDARLFSALYGRYLPTSKDAKILEVGCGAGNFISFLRGRGYREVQGIDLGEEQVTLARHLGIDDVEVANLFEYLPAHVEEFDMIVALDVIEHFTKDEILLFLDLAYQALRPRGRILLRTPNADSPFVSWILYGDFTHEIAFTPSSIKQVLKVAGFGNIQVYALEPWIHGPASAVRWIIWKMIKQIVRLYFLVEQGTAGSGVFTSNLLAVAEKI